MALGDWRVSCIEAGRATSAAPTYFEPVELHSAWPEPLLVGDEDAAEDTDDAGMGSTPKREDVIKDVMKLVTEGTPEHGSTGALTLSCDQSSVRSQSEPSPVVQSTPEAATDGEIGEQERKEKEEEEEVESVDEQALDASESEPPVLSIMASADAMGSSADASTDAETNGDKLAHPDSERRVIDLKLPDSEAVEALRVRLSKGYARSTLVRFENRTARQVLLNSARLGQGQWAQEPPSAVQPFECVVWASGNAWPLTGTKGEVSYSQTSADVWTDTASCQAVKISWENPYIVQTESRRFCTCEVTGAKGLVGSCDDTDQSYNGEVTFVLERMGEKRKYAVVNSNDADKSSVNSSALEGFLYKKQPPPGFRWQQRWFELSTSRTLRYFDVEDEKLELKGVMLLKDIASIDDVAGSETEFVIEHHEGRGPLSRKRNYMLRARNSKERKKWLDKLRELWEPSDGARRGGGSGSGKGLLVEEGLQSRAARRYQPMRLSDGGTVANNPAFIALQEAWALYGAPGCSLHEFIGRQVECLVSIGTGDPPQKRMRQVDIGIRQLAWEIFSHRELILGTT
jgi:hypothetical protein